MTVKRNAAALALGLILIGCANGGVEGAGATGVSKVAVRAGDEGKMESLMAGKLAADPDSGCLWLEGQDGQANAELLLQGQSYSVDFSGPAVILDGDDVVAREGDSVELGGGFVDSDSGVAECPVDAGIFLGYFQ